MVFVFLGDLQGEENILLCLSKEHSTASISGYQDIFKELEISPNLERISGNGILFKNAFCSTANSELSLKSILTGTLVDPKQQKKRDQLQPANIQSVLKKKGYSTVFFGNWIGDKKPEGFDYWEILEDASQFYNPKLINPHRSRKIEGHTTDIITDIALAWLKKQGNIPKPIFMVIHFNGLQQPWVPPIRNLELYNDLLLPEPITLLASHNYKAPPSRYQEMQIETNLNVESDLFLGPDVANSEATAPDRSKGDGLIRRLNGEQLSAWQLALRPQNEAFARLNVGMDGSISWKYQRYAKNYLRCVRAIDENVGRIYDFLHPNEKGDSWTFIYTASSGNFIGENGWFGGAWMYEPTMRIPLIITGEDYGKNRICESNVQLLDLFPTITGVSNQSNGGINLQSFNKENNSGENRVLYFEHYQFPDKLMVAKHYGIRNGRYKLIHYHQFDEWELFDILKDPNEQNNLYVDSIDPKLVEIIKTKLITKRKKLGLGKLLEPMPEEWRRIYRGPNARKKEQINSP